MGDFKEKELGGGGFKDYIEFLWESVNYQDYVLGDEEKRLLWKDIRERGGKVLSYFKYVDFLLKYRRYIDWGGLPVKVTSPPTKEKVVQQFVKYCLKNTPFMHKKRLVGDNFCVLCEKYPYVKRLLKGSGRLLTGAHIFSRAMYPRLRDVEGNILCLSWGFHKRLDGGLHPFKDLEFTLDEKIVFMLELQSVEGKKNLGEKILEYGIIDLYIYLEYLYGMFT